MGRKMKALIIWVLVLGLIFWQQSVYGGISYAEESVGTDITKTADGQASEEGQKSEENKDREDSKEEDGEGSQEKVRENSPEKEGEDSPEEGEKEPEEGEKDLGGKESEEGEKDAEGKDPEEKDPEEGGKDPEEKDPEEGGKEPEEKEPEEGEKEPEETNPEKSEKTPPIPFRLRISAPDGKNGYYITNPICVIRHLDAGGMTYYRLKNGSGVEYTGTLSAQNEQVQLESEYFAEGKNTLSVWMEDENGERLEDEAYNWEQSFYLDMTAPIISAQAPSGFDYWYQGSVQISVSAEDQNAIANIRCTENEQVTGEVSGSSYAEFEVTKSSHGGAGTLVKISAEDTAGNVAEIYRKLYIDREGPTVNISGGQDYMITSRAVEITYSIEEENILDTWSAVIDEETPEGNQSRVYVDDWADADGVKWAYQTLSEDGIYEISLSASDAAAHSAEEQIRVIIDSESPVIRYVDRINGNYYQAFKWEYQTTNWIEDFTNYTYTMQIDGKVYPVGNVLREEGWHTLEVKAKDSAGNEGTAKAVFKIDHTSPVVLFRNLEEDASYEEEHTFAVLLNNSEDTIDEIRINGEVQPLDGENGIYEYSVQEFQEYEVMVRASDRAGNQTVSYRTFQVTKKKTTAEKVITSVKTALGKTLGIVSENEEHAVASSMSEEDKEVENVKKSGFEGVYIPICMITFLVIAGGVGYVLMLRKR